MSDNPEALHGFPRDDLEAIADALDSGYDKTVNVGNTTGEGDEHVPSTTAVAARFIRAALAQQAATPPASVRERSPWEALFWTVAKELNCLPSSFVDANDHVIRKAREYAAAAARQAATPAPAEPVARVGIGQTALGRRATFFTLTDAGRALQDGTYDFYAAQPATPAAQPAEEVVQRLMGLTDRFASACVQRGVAARAGGATEVAGQNLVTIRAALESALRAALAQAVPAGWRLVPGEPTEGMEQAAADYLGACVKAGGLWVAMLAAAPSATQEKPAAPSEGSQG